MLIVINVSQPISKRYTILPIFKGNIEQFLAVTLPR